MKKTRLWISLFILISITVLLLDSCTSGDGGNGISEGMIEFEAKPIDVNNPLAAYAPTKMIFKFKDSKCRGELSAGMGMLNMAFISDPQKMTFTQQVRIVHQKYYHVFDVNAIKQENDTFPKFKLEESNDTKIIAGFKCKKVKLVFENPKYPPFDIYYTKDIAIENPNWSSPFKDIDGVLMEYQIGRYGFELRFTAKSVSKVANENELFETPSDYKKVTAKYLADLFKSFQ